MTDIRVEVTRMWLDEEGIPYTTQTSTLDNNGHTIENNGKVHKAFVIEAMEHRLQIWYDDAESEIRLSRLFGKTVESSISIPTKIRIPLEHPDCFDILKQHIQEAMTTSPPPGLFSGTRRVHPITLDE